MKKTKFEIEIFSRGEHNSAIIDMITNHNEGKCHLSFDIIKCYMKARACQYPSLMPPIGTMENIGENTLEIKENEKQTVTLKIVTILELEIAEN